MARKPGIWKLEKYEAKSSGKKYMRYMLDASGNRIPKEGVDISKLTAEDYNPSLKKQKAKKPRKTGIWEMAEYIAESSGKKYMKYVLDEGGNRIPKKGVDTSKLTLADYNPTLARKQRLADPNYIHKPAKKKSRRIIPSYMVSRMRTCLAPLGTFEEKRAQYIVLVSDRRTNNIDSHWVVVRVSKTHSEKIIFFNLLTEEWKIFREDLHKPAFGDKAVIFPPASNSTPVNPNAEAEIMAGLKLRKKTSRAAARWTKKRKVS